MKLKRDDRKVITIAYLITESCNNTELLSLIMLLIGEYFRKEKKKC